MNTSSDLWIVAMGHSGSTFLMGAIADAEVVKRGEGGEWPPVVTINGQLMKTMYGKENWCFQDLSNPKESNIRDIKPLFSSLNWPRVVKDPRWSCTINEWLPHCRPKAILFLGRSDPMKMAQAICRTMPKDGERFEVCLKNARQRKELMLSAMSSCLRNGVAAHWGEFPDFHEDETKRGELLEWLRGSVLGPQKIDLIEKHMHRRWKPHKVNIR